MQHKNYIIQHYQVKFVTSSFIHLEPAKQIQLPIKPLHEHLRNNQFYQFLHYKHPVQIDLLKQKPQIGIMLLNKYEVNFKTQTHGRD